MEEHELGGVEEEFGADGAVGGEVIDEDDAPLLLGKLGKEWLGLLEDVVVGAGVVGEEGAPVVLDFNGDKQAAED